jgi:tape measure domain-containing protein
MARRPIQVAIITTLDGRQVESTLTKFKAGFKTFGDEAEKSAQRTGTSFKGASSGMDREIQRAAREVSQTLRALGVTNASQFKQLTGQQTQAIVAATRDTARVSEQAAKTALRHYATDVNEAKKSSHEKLRIAETAARDSARSYDKHLGSGFFNRLGREASNAFKKSLNIDVTDAQGGGILGGALAVAGGNAITGILGKITSAITGTVSAGFDFNKLQEETALGFKVMLKDGEKALAFMRELQAFEKESPMDLPGVYEGAQRLMAMGFQAKQIVPILTAAGDAAAGLGKVGAAATQKIDQITLALGQMWQKGKVSAEEMSQQLVEAGIPAWRYLGDEIARTDAKFAALTDEQRTAKVMKMAERNMLNARTAVAVIVKGMESDFQGLGKEIAETTARGLETNISSSFSRQMGTATLPAFEKYKKVLGTTLNALNSEVADKIVGGVSTGTGALLDAMDFTVGAVMRGDISGLGLSIASGLAGGMKQGAVVVGGAARDLAQSGIDAAKDTLGIKSPSLVFFEIGLQTARGYELGFKQGMSGLQSEIIKILSRTGDTLTKIAERSRVPVESLMQANQKLIEQLRQMDDRLPVTMADLPAGTEIRIPQMRDAVRNSRNKSISRDFLEQASQDARVQAMLEALRIAEGGQPNIVVGGGRFDMKNPAHPGSYGMGMMGAKGWSTAAGNWQITQTNWKKLAPQLGLDNFGDVHQQMIAALALYQQSGGLSALLSGDMQGAFKGTQPWAASPFSSLPGGKRKDFAELFNKQLAGLAGGQAALVAQQGGLSPQEQAELEAARLQIAVLQKSIDAYNARLSGKSVSTIDPQTLDIVGGSTPDIFIGGKVNIPSDLTGAQKQNAIQDDILQQKMVVAVSNLQARVVELEAKLASSRAPLSTPADAPFDFSGIDISGEQAQHVLEIFDRARNANQLLSEDVSRLATEVVPRALQAVPLPALAAQDAFENLPPLIKEATDSAAEFEKRMDDAAKGLSGVFGDAFFMLFDKPRDALRSFGKDFKNWLLGMAKDYFESEMYKLLKGDSGGAAGGSGGLISGIIGSIGRLFGLGKSATSGAAGIASAGASAGGAAASLIPSLLSGGRVGGSFGFGMPSSNTLLSAISELSGGKITAPQSIGEQNAVQSKVVSVLSQAAQKTGSASSLTSSLMSSLASAGPAALIAYGAQVLSDSFSGNLSNRQALLGGGLLPFFINRSALRRKEEKLRTELSGDVYADTIKILNATRAGEMALAEAISQFNQVEQNYLSAVSKFKDSKTRRIAEAWFRNDFKPFYEPLIRQAAAEATQHKVNDDQLTPEFADGGATWRRFADGGTTHPMFKDALKGYQVLPDNFLGRVPGVYDRKDNIQVAVSGDEVILPPKVWKPITPYLKKQRLPGFADGGGVSDAPTLSLPSSSNQKEGKTPIHVTAHISFNGKEFVVETMESDEGREVTFETMSSYEGQKVTNGNYKQGRRKGSIR